MIFGNPNRKDKKVNKSIIETITGTFVLLVAVFFVIIFVSKTTNVKLIKNQYELKAKFENIEGVEEGSPVKIGGVKIGTVLSKDIDHQTYNAILNFSIDNSIQIPIDSTAKISSEGLLGGKFLSIQPGGDDKMLANNEEIKYTQSSVNLETLIGKMIFSKEGNK